MKVLMLPTYHGGIGWWRFQVPAKYLAQAGVDAWCPTADQLDAKIKRVGSFDAWLDANIKDYDVVHVGYTPSLDFAKAVLVACEKYNVPVIVDIDDDFDKVPTYNTGYRGFYPGSPGQKIAKTLARHAAHVTFSTKPLAKALGYLNHNNTVLENWVDIDSWDHPTPPERAADKGIRLMMTGGRGRYGDWQIVKEPLEWAMNKYPNLRLFFLGATPDWVAQWMPSPNDPLANRAFYLQTTQGVALFNQMVRYVAPDIILSPTAKNDFNASKSGLKFYEAALAGAAFVCTDYDTYSCAPNDCCLKVDNTYAQWQGALENLIENAQLRQGLADRAKAYVLDSCGAEAHIEPRITLYEKVVEANLANNTRRMVGVLPTHQEPVHRQDSQ